MKTVTPTLLQLCLIGGALAVPMQDGMQGQDAQDKQNGQATQNGQDGKDDADWWWPLIIPLPNILPPALTISIPRPTVTTPAITVPSSPSITIPSLGPIYIPGTGTIQIPGFPPITIPGLAIPDQGSSGGDGVAAEAQKVSRDMAASIAQDMADQNMAGQEISSQDMHMRRDASNMQDLPSLAATVQNMANQIEQIVKDSGNDVNTLLANVAGPLEQFHQTLVSVVSHPDITSVLGNSDALGLSPLIDSVSTVLQALVQVVESLLAPGGLLGGLLGNSGVGGTLGGVLGALTGTGTGAPGLQGVLKSIAGVTSIVPNLLRPLLSAAGSILPGGLTGLLGKIGL
ncbi:hypothetical protein B0T26DRAFT_745534 [Lasiosphaeria miniovina]|uniref:Uncharacterized protein n=1 Tax=Lasiosphaeria miniovina TaxID=1954250 RepID=A0AA40BFY9_9PEZI|nr:uncharacterized protein B0T26DRAFT_745534 [Lasiosphaeria miniovina]KAK0733499.1 hypothetical protein B0T26DRAFT_745534 [Lasiosphaeria miniovina]